MLPANAGSVFDAFCLERGLSDEEAREFAEFCAKSHDGMHVYMLSYDEVHRCWVRWR